MNRSREESEARKAQLDRVVQAARAKEARDLIDAIGLQELIKGAVAAALAEDRQKRSDGNS